MSWLPPGCCSAPISSSSAGATSSRHWLPLCQLVPWALPLSSASSRRAAGSQPGRRSRPSRCGRPPCSVTSTPACRRKTVRPPVKLPQGARRQPQLPARMTLMPLRSTSDGRPAGQVAAKVGPRGLQRTSPQKTSPQKTGLRKPGLRGISLAALLRRHWLLAAGLTLRVLAQIAYRPALLYIDSVKYLYIANGADPVGYRVLLKPLLAVGNLDVVAAVQHLLGLGMAVALYLLMRRRGVPRWLAALATAPILLDGYQLQNEQTIMPDTLFEALIVTGLVIMLWLPRPKRWMIIAAGITLGASATVAQIGQILILPTVIYLLVAVPGWRAKLTKGTVLCAAFALPIVAYCSVSLVDNGHFRLAYTGSNDLYGRLVMATNCQSLNLPAYEQALCPTRQRA